MADTLATVQVVRTDHRRKTLALEVHPNGAVCVRAPADCDDARIEAMLAKRERWISEQRAYFRRFDPRTPARVWVAGESHLHLGRRYKLRLACQSTQCVEIRGADLVVTLAQDAGGKAAQVESLVARWRHRQAQAAFPPLLAQCHRHYRFQGLALPPLRIQRLSKRWGSLSAGGTMTLHSGLVQAPAACIRYVMLHELCHLLHPDHSASFFELLGEVCPGWEAHKQRLEVMLR
ncbi:MAG: hypothetical protein RJA98_1900 [Pseudomonadota bacterium]|jgi:predicted metal-dependent hydrolase